MKGWFIRGQAALLSLMFAAVAEAQSMSVSPSPVLQGGQPATINYSNPNLANTKVTIEISFGFPIQIETVTIKLDGNGEGSGTWIANPNWFGAAFNAPDVPEIARAISR